MTRTAVTTETIDYPDSDGLPMAENDSQRTTMTYAIEALDAHFWEHPDVYVSGNLLMYYEEGNNKVRVAPDIFVVFGTTKHHRSSYLLWQEAKAPDFVMEVASGSTREDDQGRKRDIYARLEVPEYWQYDPTGDYLAPPLQGFLLSDGGYGRALALERVGAVWSVYSPVLGLNLRLHGGVLRFHDPMTDEYLLTPLEENRARQEAENRFRESEQARREAEARLVDVEARLRALQQSTPPGRPDQSDR
jgi:Uma2 family endonuclease